MKAFTLITVVLLIIGCAWCVDGASLGDVAESLTGAARHAFYTVHKKALYGALKTRNAVERFLAAPSPTTLCNSNTHAAVLFADSAACDMFKASPVVGSDHGTAWSNCTTSAYCLQYNTMIIDLSAFNAIGIAAVSTVGASIQFSTQSACMVALNASQMGGYMSGRCLPNGALTMHSSGGNCGWFTVIWGAGNPAQQASFARC